jgi:hypothetical protein
MCAVRSPALLVSTARSFCAAVKNLDRRGHRDIRHAGGPDALQTDH